MSGRVLHYNPQYKGFSLHAPDGGFISRMPVQTNQPGVVENKPQKQPGPVILTQKPAEANRQ